MQQHMLPQRNREINESVCYHNLKQARLGIVPSLHFTDLTLFLSFGHQRWSWNAIGLRLLGLLIRG